MTLSRRLSITLSVLIFSLILLASAALSGVVSMRSDVKELMSEYHELRLIDSISISLAEVSGALRDVVLDEQYLFDRLSSAVKTAREFIKVQEADEHSDQSHAEREESLILTVLHDVETLQSQIRAALDGQIALPREEAQVRVDQILQKLRALADETVDAVHHARTDATLAMRRTLWITLITAAAVIAGAAAIGISQHRSMTSQLDRLREGVHRLSQKRFAQSLPIEGDREFADLASDFNNMASTLHELYETLEEKVRQKTRELVKSERLASVGFLAAGVAHEINSPLSIISTYAELSLRDLESLDHHPAVDEVRRSLRIMHEEAYRCKGIIEKLISLTRMGDGSRQLVGPARIVRDVASLVGKLPKYRDRQLCVEVAAIEDVLIHANEPELRQVLLNLTANALEAAPARHGQVSITGERSQESVRICVTDNGVGMTPATIERVFEPFFTTKPSDGGSGLGLGLSICHAIITSHQGRIWAQSEGPGAGSRFFVELPISPASTSAPNALETAHA